MLITRLQYKIKCDKIIRALRAQNLWIPDNYIKTQDENKRFSPKFTIIFYSSLKKSSLKGAFHKPLRLWNWNSHDLCNRRHTRNSVKIRWSAASLSRAGRYAHRLRWFRLSLGRLKGRNEYFEKIKQKKIYHLLYRRNAWKLRYAFEAQGEALERRKGSPDFR